MSTPRITIERVALVIVPIATAVVFIAVLAMEKVEVRYDLQLISPGQVSPGATVPLRAFFFTPTEGVGPTEAEARQIDVSIDDAAGAVVVVGTLAPSLSGMRTDQPMGPPIAYEGRFGMEGVLDAPAAVGDYTIRATVREQGEIVARCDAPLVVSGTPRRSEPRGRPMMPLQQWRLGPVTVAEGAQGPSAFELRVHGGYCTPGLDCSLYAWVRGLEAELSIEGAGFEPNPPTADAGAPGIARFTGRVTGPEASVVLLAHADGQEIARREIRLPIVLSGIEVGRFETICPPPCQPTYTAPNERPLLVDAFHEGVWALAASVAPRQGDAAVLPVELSRVGLWRLQIREDPFGVESAATRFVYVGEPSDAPRAFREHLVAEESDDAFTRAMPVTGISAERQGAYAAALLEMDVVPLPQPRSGRVQADLGLGRDQSAARWLAALFVLAIGLVIAGWVMRRGLDASAEARALMTEAGDKSATSRKNVASMTLAVVGVVLATVLAFAAAALLLLTRGV